MYKSKDINTSVILDFIGEENLNHIDEYVNEVLRRNFIVLKTDEEIDKFFEPIFEDLYNNLSYDDETTLRYYTTRAHQSINSVLRNKWNYEVSGRLTKEDKEFYKKTADEMDSIISKNRELPDNLITYRAVGINAFRDYGVSKIEDLPDLVGEYLYEAAFTSTSIKRNGTLLDTSDWYGKRTIEIEYLIPYECQDGLPLTMSGFSFYTEESEYLINKDSLIKIVDVNISDDKSHAYIKAVYIPIKIWDRARYDQQSISR